MNARRRIGAEIQVVAQDGAELVSIGVVSVDDDAPAFDQGDEFEHEVGNGCESPCDDFGVVDEAVDNAVKDGAVVAENDAARDQVCAVDVVLCVEDSVENKGYDGRDPFFFISSKDKVLQEDGHDDKGGYEDDRESVNGACAQIGQKKRDG